MIKQYTDDYQALFETDYWNIRDVDELLVKHGNFYIAIDDDDQNILVVKYSDDEYLVCTEMNFNELLQELQETGFYETEEFNEMADDCREFYTSC